MNNNLNNIDLNNDDLAAIAARVRFAARAADEAADEALIAARAVEIARRELVESDARCEDESPFARAQRRAALGRVIAHASLAAHAAALSAHAASSAALAAAEDAAAVAAECSDEDCAEAASAALDAAIAAKAAATAVIRRGRGLTRRGNEAGGAMGALAGLRLITRRTK